MEGLAIVSVSMMPFMLLIPAIFGAIKPEKILPKALKQGRLYGFVFGLWIGYTAICFPTAFFLEEGTFTESMYLILVNVGIVWGILSLVLIPGIRQKLIGFLIAVALLIVVGVWLH